MGNADRAFLLRPAFTRPGVPSSCPPALAAARSEVRMLDRNTVSTDPFVRGIVRRKVRRLIRGVGFAAHEAEDLEQEILLRLIRSLDAYDPSQCRHPNVFVTTVVERAAGMLLRARLARKRAAGRTRSLDRLLHDPGAECGPAATEPGMRRPGGTHRDPEESFDLVEDVAALERGLPVPLRELAAQLRAHGVTVAARNLGITVSTLRRRRRELRRAFAAAEMRHFL